MFNGWVENPVYINDDDGDGDEEIVVEMNISYCPKCNKVIHSELKARPIDVADETMQMLESHNKF